jgi:hypothetical protein
MKTKEELLEEIVEKQDELITATKIFIAFEGHNFNEVTGSERLENDIASLKSQLAEAGEEKRNELIKAYSDLVTEIDKHKGTTIKEIKLRNKIANLKLQIR